MSALVSLILEHDLVGEALGAAVAMGPEALKEAIPSLSKRLKLIGAVKLMKSFLSDQCSDESCDAVSTVCYFFMSTNLQFMYRLEVILSPGSTSTSDVAEVMYFIMCGK